MTKDEPRAPPALRIVAVAAIVVLAFAGASYPELRIYDEPREAELARAAWRTGEWAFTILNERPFLEKPPLFTLSVAAVFAALGSASILAARVVAALWSLGTLGVVAWFAKRTIGAHAAIFAALVLATTNRFESCQHTILLDNALVFFTTSALACGYLGATERRRGLALLAGLALGGAFLTKGLVGVGVVGLVLALELAWRRDRAGARTLLHPLVLLGAIGPPVLYAALLGARGGPAFLHELLWNNQFGRFLASYHSKHSNWHVYASTWWETVAPWTPLAAVALVRRSANPAARFLRLWALAPLVALTFSAARSRFYAVPVVPAHALLVALLAHEVELGPRALEVLSKAWLVLAAAASGVAISVIAVGGVDGLSVLAALGPLATLLLRRAPSRESRALGLAFVALSPWLLWASAPATRLLRAPKIDYDDLATNVWRKAGERRLVLFHCNDSFSGTFAFQADRSVLGLDAVEDPDGAELIATVTSSDVVLAPEGALNLIPEARRKELVAEWRWTSPRDPSQNAFVLYRKRPAP